MQYGMDEREAVKVIVVRHCEGLERRGPPMRIARRDRPGAVDVWGPRPEVGGR